MPQGINFDEEQKILAGRKRQFRGEEKFAQWLVKIGLVKNPQEANIFFLILGSLLIVLAVWVTFSFGGGEEASLVIEIDPHESVGE